MCERDRQIERHTDRKCVCKSCTGHILLGITKWHVTYISANHKNVCSNHRFDPVSSTFCKCTFDLIYMSTFSTKFKKINILIMQHPVLKRTLLTPPASSGNNIPKFTVNIIKNSMAQYFFIHIYNNVS